jgi:hypothetical protein
MPTTINKKKKRIRTTPIPGAPRFRNWGGFLIDPPEDCTKPMIAPDGGRWVDLGICLTTCAKAGKAKTCERWQWFLKAKPEEREIDKANRGVMTTSKIPPGTLATMVIPK